MFWTFSVIFLSLWLVGVSTPSTLHGYIHILLALAIATMVVPLIWRRKQPDRLTMRRETPLACAASCRLLFSYSRISSNTARATGVAAEFVAQFPPSHMRAF